MRNAYCTIITADHYFFAQTLFTSLRRHSSKPVILEVLVADSQERLDSSAQQNKPDGLNLWDWRNIHGDMANKLRAKYAEINMDSYRWSMKPVFINHLFRTRGYERLLYIDADLHFFQTRRFFSMNSKMGESCFRRIGVAQLRKLINRTLPCFLLTATLTQVLSAYVRTRQKQWTGGQPHVITLALPCLTKAFSPTRNIWMPWGVFFDGVKVLRHKGCNVAGWNTVYCKRTKTADGQVLINDEYPIVFIHFTRSTIRNIFSGADDLLWPHLEQYADALRQSCPTFDLIARERVEMAAWARRRSSLICRAMAKWPRIKARLSRLM